MTDTLEIILAASGPVTAVVFAGAARLFRAEADDAVRDRLSEQLRGELAAFKVELLAGINGTYRRTSECQLIESGVCQRLDSIDTRLHQVQSDAHELRGLQLRRDEA
jgi:hypothetical protein